MGLLRSLRKKLHAKKRTLKNLSSTCDLSKNGGGSSWRHTRKSARRRRKRKSKSRGKKRTCPVTGEPICYCKN